MKIIVFDFDRTLTNYDTTLPFFLHCTRNPLKRLIIIILAIICKLNIIQVKTQKRISLQVAGINNISIFEEKCLSFAPLIRLNNIYFNHYLEYIKRQDCKVYIISASFRGYLRSVFKLAYIIGTELKLDSFGCINGIENHPYRDEKARLLRKNGIERIDIFFTDSENDRSLMDLSQQIIFIRNGKII